MKIINTCLVVILFFLSCSNRAIHQKYKTINSSENELSIIECKKALICYKFLYNADYPIEINEKSFWGYGKIYKEFAYKKLDASMENMIKSIKTFDRKDNLKDFTYTYAFVNNCQDTIYADYMLEKWIIKTNGKSNYYEYNKASKQPIDTLTTKGLPKYDKFFRY